MRGGGARRGVFLWQLLVNETMVVVVVWWCLGGASDECPLKQDEVMRSMRGFPVLCVQRVASRFLSRFLSPLHPLSCRAVLNGKGREKTTASSRQAGRVEREICPNDEFCCGVGGVGVPKRQMGAAKNLS